MRLHCILGKAIIVLLWSFPMMAWGQSFGQARGQSIPPSFQHVTVNDGLSSNIIYDLLKDQQGFLWLATSQGLNRYDGKTVKTYRHQPNDSTSLSHDIVIDILEAKDGSLWVGTERGLNHMDPRLGTFKRYLQDDNDATSLSREDISELYQDSDGTIWIATWGGGVNRYNNTTDTFTNYRHNANVAASLSHDIVHSFAETPDGSLWVGTDAGLDRFDKKTGTFTRFKHEPGNPNSLGNNIVLELFVAKDGTLWIGTEGGVSRLDPETGAFTVYNHEPGNPASLPNNVVRAFYETEDGVLWVGTSGGVSRLNPEQNQFITYSYNVNDPTSLSNNVVYDLFGSDDGILWIGTWGGLNRFDSEEYTFTYYDAASYGMDSSVQNHIRALYITLDGMLWAGTWAGGLIQYDLENGQSRLYQHNPNDPTSLSHDVVRTILETQDGTLWVGTQGGGLSKMDRETGTFIHYKHGPGNRNSLTSNIVLDLFETRSGELWVGTLEGGINRFDPVEETFTHFQDQQANFTTFDVKETRDGIRWVATWGGGLNRYDPSTKVNTNYRHKASDSTSLSNDVVWVVYEAGDGTLWTGTDSGLSRIHRSHDGDPASITFTSYNSPESNYAGGAVKSILEDSQGKLWLGMANGKLARFDPETKHFRNFDAHSIQQLGSFTKAAVQGPANSEDYGNTMFFGGYGGIISFDPKDTRHEALLPQIMLTDFKLFNKSVTSGPDAIFSTPFLDDEEITLTHAQNDLSFDFTAFEYHNPEGIRFNYRLLPYDEDWRGVTDQRSATYTSLKPGHYTFEVKAANINGIWTEGHQLVRFQLQAPWWLSAWAYVLYGLIALVCVVALSRVHQRRLVKRERDRVRERELEQARQLKQAYQELEVTHASLESEKLKTEAQAEQLRELDQAKNRFFANISHEFRTPLTLILGPVQQLLKNLEVDGSKDKGLKDETSRQSLLMVERNASRLLQLINQLLDLARLDSGKVQVKAEEVDFLPFIKGIVMSYESLAEMQDIDLKIECKEPAIQLYFEPEKMVQVFNNLLSNAFKFTPRGGSIAVKIDAVETGVDRGAVQIAVSDTGEGIPTQQLSRIFDRFYQVESSNVRNYEGSGIGLALVKELVELHHGEISVTSEAGKGSTFTVLIKRGKDHFTSEELARKEESAAFMTHDGDGIADVSVVEIAAPMGSPIDNDAKRDQQQKLVLIIEDNPDVRSYIRLNLEAHYQIVEAEDGEAGIAKALEIVPDIIISDLMMPKADGYEVCRTLKLDEKTSHIPIILLTARAEMKDKLEGLETGADDYLTKPFSFEELQVRVKNLISLREKLLKGLDKRAVLKPAEIATTSIDQAFLERVMHIVELNMGREDFALADLCREVAMSERQLRRKLKALTNQSPNQFIRSFRLQRAFQLIEQNAGTISEISYQVGFNSPAYFTKTFKEYFGKLPSEVGVK